MKKISGIKKALAVVLVAAISVSITLSGFGSEKVQAAGSGNYIIDSGIGLGEKIIEQCVPGGRIVAKGVDIVLGLIFDEPDKGPSNQDILDKIDGTNEKTDQMSEEINANLNRTNEWLGKIDARINKVNCELAELRSSIERHFEDIGYSMTMDTRHIENKIITQSVIGNNGRTLDALMTSLEGVADQINAIVSDRNLSAAEKALEMNALIGNNTLWNRNDNFYFGTKNLIDMLRLSSFMDNRSNRDFFQVVYDDFAAECMFSGEALDHSRAFVDRMMLLSLYSYTISIQCLDAAHIVSGFSDEFINNLSTKGKNIYNNTCTLAIIVQMEKKNLTDRLFNIEKSDSVVSHYKKYIDTDRMYFVNRGLTEKYCSKTLATKSRYSEGNGYGDAVRNFNEFAGKSLLDRFERKALVEYVKQNYPGKTLREYLEYIGFDTTSAEPGASFMVEDIRNEYRKDRMPYPFTRKWLVYTGAKFDKAADLFKCELGSTPGYDGADSRMTDEYTDDYIFITNVTGRGIDPSVWAKSNTVEDPTDPGLMVIIVAP